MKSKGNEIDFNGKPIFIGLDVHKKTWKAKFCSQNTVQKTITLEKPFVQNLVKYLDRSYPGADYQAVYEAGFCGYWIQRELDSVGIKTKVVHPADIPTTDKEREFKDDKRDSRKLSLALRSGELEEIYIPGVEAQKDRSLVRERWSIAGSQKRVKNQIKSQLLFCGYDIPDDFSDKYWSRKFVSWLEQLSEKQNEDGLRFKIDRHLILRDLELKITRELRKLSQEQRFDANFKIIHSVPGIGLKNGMLLLTELIDIRRFKSRDALMSYAGLIPSSSSSGDKERTGNMTKRGNRKIRTAMIESSWVAIRHDTELALKYEEYITHMSKQKAIVRIARILLSRVRQILLKQEKYQTRLN